jgi:hypothetical protein
MLKRATEQSWSKCLVRIHGDGRQAHALWCWNWTANACSALDPEATALLEPFQCRRSLPDSRRVTLHKNCFSKFVLSRCAEACQFDLQLEEHPCQRPPSLDSYAGHWPQ